MYSAEVMRFLAAALSIAGGKDAGQRIRRLLVKRKLSPVVESRAPTSGCVPLMARRCIVILENRGALRRVQGQGYVPPAFASARLMRHYRMSLTSWIGLTSTLLT